MFEIQARDARDEVAEEIDILLGIPPVMTERRFNRLVRRLEAQKARDIAQNTIDIQRAVTDIGWARFEHRDD